jgi:hypothetical protein
MSTKIDCQALALHARERSRAGLPWPAIGQLGDEFVGGSRQFAGADRGDVNISVFLLDALPGRGPGPHRHPCNEVQFVREGRGHWKVDGREFQENLTEET